LHPKLHSLWQAVAAIGHVVYIELPNQNVGKADIRLKAGEFILEKTDQNRHASAAAIRLCP